MASSAYSSGVEEPLHSNRRTRFLRISRYRSAATSRSRASEASKPLKASTVRDHFSERIFPPDLPPFSLKRERRPIVRRLPTFGSPHRYLRGPQCGRWPLAARQHAFIKMLHHLRARAIVDLPHARYHARRAGIKKSARQSDESFALDLSTKRGLARAQHHEVRGEPQVINVIEAEKSVSRPPGPIDQREHNTRQFGVLIIEQTMRCEMHDPILPQIRAQHRIAAFIEIQSLQISLAGCQSHDLIGFVPAEAESHKILQAQVGG